MSAAEVAEKALIAEGAALAEKKPPATTVKISDTQVLPVLGKDVRMSTLQEGDGVTFPWRNSMVRIHYAVHVKESGVQLDSTRDAGHPALFKLGVGELVDGLDAAIGKMSLGQHCSIEVDAPFHYGKHGWAPMVPEGCTLVYSVELLAFDDPQVQ